MRRRKRGLITQKAFCKGYVPACRTSIRLSILTQPTLEREQSDSGQCREVSRGFSTNFSVTPQIRQSLRKQAFEITSTVNYTQNENLTLARLIEDQVFGETCDRHAAGATKFVCREATAWPNSRTLSNPQQRGNDRLFPTLRQTPICLSFVPIKLLQNICNRCITESNPRFFHARRARSR